MEENKNHENEQRQQRNVMDKTTDESGLHLENPPKGAEQMNADFSQGPPTQQPGDSSRYANTSDNEDEDARS